MDEEKRNSGGATARIPDWLLDELEEIIKGYPRGKKPTRGSLLAEAWEIVRKMQQDQSSSKGPVNSGKPPLASGKPLGHNLVIPKAEYEWPQEFKDQMADFLAILRAGRREAIDPLTANLKGFRLLSDLCCRIGAQLDSNETTTPPVPTPISSSGPDQQIPVEKPRDREDSIEQLKEDLDRFQDEITDHGKIDPATGKRVAKRKRGDRGGAAGGR